MVNRSKRWEHSRTCVYNLGYHIIWCPKYRKKVLNEPVAKRLGQILRWKSYHLGTKIEAIEIMPDHIHMFIKIDSRTPICWVVKQLKGYSSYKLRMEYKHLNKLPTLWTRSYYCESIGHISEPTIRRYIEDQRAMAK